MERVAIQPVALRPMAFCTSDSVEQRSTGFASTSATSDSDRSSVVCSAALTAARSPLGRQTNF